MPYSVQCWTCTALQYPTELGKIRTLRKLLTGMIVVVTNYTFIPQSHGFGHSAALHHTAKEWPFALMCCAISSKQSVFLWLLFSTCCTLPLSPKANKSRISLWHQETPHTLEFLTEFQLDAIRATLKNQRTAEKYGCHSTSTSHVIWPWKIEKKSNNNCRIKFSRKKVFTFQE